MVLLEQSGFWDASRTLSPGSISDPFNGQEHEGKYPPPPKSSTSGVSQATLGPTPANTLLPAYHPLTVKGEFDTPQ